jgi:MFS family permease
LTASSPAPARTGLPLPAHRLVAAAFVCDFAIGMVALAVQNLGIYVLDAPNAVLGLFATLGAGAYSLGCVFAGTLSDRFGRRRCVVAGCLGAAAVWLLIPHMHSWASLLIILPLPGAFLSLFWPSVQAWIAELSTSPRLLSRNLSLFNIVWSIGLMLGPVVTGYMWLASPTWTFLMPALMVLGLVPLALTTPRGQSQEEAGPAPAENGRADGDRFLRLAWIGNFAAWFAGGVIMAMFPKLGYTLHYSEPHTGWLLFSFRVGQVALFIATLYVHRWQYRLWPMLLGEVLAAAGLLAAAATDSSAVFAAGFAIAGLAAGMTYVSSLFYSLHGRTSGKGRTSGLHEAVLGGGGFLGPLLGGLCAQFIGLRAPFVLAAAVLLLACIAQVQLAARARRPVAEAAV